MLPSLQSFIEVTDFLTSQGRYETVREITLAATRSLPSQSHEDKFYLATFAAGAFFKSKNYEDALEWIQRACLLDPQNPQIAHQLALCLTATCREGEAEKLLRDLHKAFPDQAFLAVDLAVALFYQGQFDEAQEHLEGVLAQFPENHPDRAIAHFNLHWHWMRKGRFKESMRAFLSIEKKFEELHRPELQPTDDVRGKRVLILHRNGGAGDELVNVRFVKYLAQRGALVTWRTHHHFESLFSRVEGVHKVTSLTALPDPNLLDFDFWISEGSLVQFLDFELPDLSQEPYIFADPQKIEFWSQKIPARGKLRVGLRWQGTMSTDKDMHRSVPFAELSKFFDLPDIEFYSLQRDTGVEDILPTDPVIDLSPDLHTWEDTAAAIHCLDLVITNCTSLVHLSGALGKKTWLYTPLGCFYLWALPGDKAHWYKDVTLFRQTRRRDWSGVTAAIRAELEKSI